LWFPTARASRFGRLSQIDALDEGSAARHGSGASPKWATRYLRKLLVVGACATLRHRKGHNDALRPWASGMLEPQDSQIQVQADRSRARQQGRAYRLRANDEGRPIRRPASCGLTTQRAR
jgi:hypothetical protein